MAILRHLAVLLREVGGYAWRNRAWWLLPVVIVLLLLSLLVVIGSGVTPFIYTVF